MSRSGDHSTLKHNKDTASGNNASASLSCARAFGRAEGTLFFPLPRHLFLSAQARLGNVTGLLSSVPAGTVAYGAWPIIRPCGLAHIAFRRSCRRRAYAGCGPERAALSPETNTHLDTRALRPGVSSFCAAAAQKKHSAVSTQQSAKPARKNRMFSGHEFVKMYYFAIEI
jgi:hypothetical protein